MKNLGNNTCCLKTLTCVKNYSLQYLHKQFNIGVNKIKKSFKKIKLVKCSFNKKEINHVRRNQKKHAYFKSKFKTYHFISQILQNIIFKQGYLKKKKKLQFQKKKTTPRFKTYYILEHLTNKKKNKLIKPSFLKLSKNLKKKKFKLIQKNKYPIFKKRFPYSHIHIFKTQTYRKIQTITDILLVNITNLTEKYSIKILKKIPWKSKFKSTYYLYLKNYLKTKSKISYWNKRVKKFIFLSKKILKLRNNHSFYQPYKFNRRVLFYSLTSIHIYNRLKKHYKNHLTHRTKICWALKRKKKSLKFFFKKLRYSWTYLWMRQKTNKFRIIKYKPKKIFFKKKIKKKYKHKIIRFWFFFKNSSKIKYYRLKSFYKKFLIFKSFFNKFIFNKLNKKTQIKFGVNAFFWKLESRVDIFLIRNGYIRNIEQSNFILQNKLVYINSNLVKKNYSYIFINDIVQINWFFILFTKLFFDKLVAGCFFFFQNIFLKKKYPFYIEQKQCIHSSILIFKPEPFFNVFNNNILNFNFFFYRYLFYFIKKKTF